MTFRQVATILWADRVCPGCWWVVAVLARAGAVVFAAVAILALLALDSAIAWWRRPRRAPGPPPPGIDRRGFLASLAAVVSAPFLPSKPVSLGLGERFMERSFTLVAPPCRYDVLYGFAMVRPDLACLVRDDPEYDYSADTDEAMAEWASLHPALGETMRRRIETQPRVSQYVDEHDDWINRADEGA